MMTSLRPLLPFWTAFLVLPLALVATACAGTATAPSSSPEGAATTAPAAPSPTEDTSVIPEPGCPEEKVTLAQTGGRTAGYLYRPDASDTPARPLVISMHGGSAQDPEQADRAALRNGRVVASHLCPLGYNVFSVDYRWSPFGREEMTDVGGAFGYMSQMPYVDGARIVAMGESHGGYMATLAVASPLIERSWAAAVNLYGFVDVADLVQSEPNNAQVQLTVEQLGGTAGNGVYDEISPARLVDSLDTPLLIVVGSDDQLADQLRSFRDKLKDAAKTFEYTEIEGAPSGFIAGQEPYTDRLWQRVIDYLKQTFGE
jgi:acetyl esterase/lipase